MTSQGGAGVVSCTVLLAVALCASARAGDVDFRTHSVADASIEELQGVSRKLHEAGGNSGKSAKGRLGVAAVDRDGFLGVGNAGYSRKLLVGGINNGAEADGVAASGNSAKGGIGVSTLNGDGIAGTGGSNNGAANGGTAGTRRKLLEGVIRKLFDGGGNSGKSADGGVGVSVLRGDGIQGAGASNLGAANGGNVGNGRR